MKRVLTALVVIPPVLAAVLWLRPWIFSLLVGMLALVAVDEFINLAEAAAGATLRASRIVTMLAVAVLFVAFPLRTEPFYGPLFERVCGGLLFADR